jgi:hypothetical protein
MARRVLGPVKWGGSIGKDCGRTYTITWKCECEVGDGPARVLQTPGLPTVGTQWLIDGDVDIWAWCTPEMTAKPQIDGERTDIWLVDQSFTTKPIARSIACCKDEKIDDPLLEPMKISWESIDDKEEATTDRFGNPVINSAWEQLRGPPVEFARGRTKYIIEQNVPLLQQEVWEVMKNTVNDSPMWGLPRRSVRLARVSAERKFYGLCYKYFTRKFEFETMAGIHPVHGKVVSEFDRDVLDEGTKCLDGDWTPGGNYVVKKIAGKDANPLNPSHFKKFKDRQGSNTHVILDGRGKPYIPDPPTKKVGSIDVLQFYDVSGFAGSLSNLNVRLTLLEPSPDPTNSPFWWRGGGGSTGVAQIDLRVNLGDVPPIYELFVSGSTSVNASYLKFAVDWDTLGPNVLVVDPAIPKTSVQPYSVVVTPGGTTSPGYRHIEYYKESNFLVLGIPLTF